MMRLFNFFFKSITFSNIKEDMAFWQTFESCHIFFGNIPLILQNQNSKKNKNHKIPINKKFISKKEIFISQKQHFLYAWFT